MLEKLFTQDSHNTMDQIKSKEEYLKIIENLIPGIDIWDERYDYVMHDDHWLTSKWSPECPKCQAEGKKPPVTEGSIFNNNSTLKNIDTNLNNGANNTYTQPVVLPPMIVPITPIAPIRLQARLGNGTFDRLRDKSALKQPGHDQNLIDLNETFDLYRSALEQTPQMNNQPSQQQQQQHQNNLNQQQQTSSATSRIPKIPIRSSRP